MMTDQSHDRKLRHEAMARSCHKDHTQPDNYCVPGRWSSHGSGESQGWPLPVYWEPRLHSKGLTYTVQVRPWGTGSMAIGCSFSRQMQLRRLAILADCGKRLRN